jgi:hypothetical protein
MFAPGEETLAVMASAVRQHCHPLPPRMIALVEARIL